MKSSDIKYYLNKAKHPKGDNTKPDPPVHQFNYLMLADH